jgi:type I restriction enzyme S subunit
MQEGSGNETLTMVAGEKLDVLCSAVGGIKALRRLVLGLAVTGRLSTRSLSDEPAQLLLERLGKERVAARGPSNKTAKPVTGPFALPSTWRWARLDQLWQSITDGDHQPPPKSERGIAFLTIGNVSRGAIDFTSTRFVGEDYFAGLDQLRVPRRGDLLYTVVGSFGIPVVVDTDRPFCVQRHIAILKPLPSTNVQFLRYLMTSDVVFQQAAAGATGIAQPTVGLGVLRNIEVPVPPLAEQGRIVAKVDGLMRMIDNLEAKQTREREVQVRLRTAALGALTSAEDPKEFDAAWKRVAENFGVLFERADSIGELRRTVLDLAVRGVLVASHPADGEAPAFAQSDVSPHPLPPGWRWSHIEAVSSHVVDCPHSTPKYTDAGYPAIRTADVVPGRLLLDRARLIDEAQYRERIRRLEPTAGDILYSREGERLGIAACVPPGVRLCLAQRMMQLRVRAPMFAPFVMWAMNSRLVYSQAVRGTGGSTSPHVNIKDIRRFVLPVPPIPQQHRIVAKVEHLMKLCDDLEARLRRSETTASKLVEAVVAELVA